jgi:hypothetical protein
MLSPFELLEVLIEFITKVLSYRISARNQVALDASNTPGAI